jgi:phospholipase D1/2
MTTRRPTDRDPPIAASSSARHGRVPAPLSKPAVALALAVVLVALAIAWRYTPLHALLDPPRMLAMARQVREWPLAPLWTLGFYVVGGLLVFPVVALIAATGLVWGVPLGVALALTGSVLSAAVTYSIGRGVGADLARRYGGDLLNRLSERLSQHGLGAVVMVRLLPLAPFSVVNVLAGALRVRLRDFLLGTVIGMAPGIVVTVAFADSLARALHQPGWSSISMLGLALLLAVAAAFGTRQWLARRSARAASSTSNTE